MSDILSNPPTPATDKKKKKKDKKSIGDIQVVLTHQLHFNVDVLA